MKTLDTRRTNPISRAAALAVGILILFEALVIGGVFELEAQTVAKYAPWAYEPFLKLVGEHPASKPRGATIEKPKESDRDPSAIAGVAEFAPAAIPVPVETNEAPPAIIPVPEPVPPPAAPEKIVPVG
jgi:hypothetical protein